MLISLAACITGFLLDFIIGTDRYNKAEIYGN